jgi:hypothetical protein
VPELATPIDSAPYIPLHAGPNEPVGLLGAHKDAIAWSSAPRNYLLEWVRHVKDEKVENSFNHTLHHALKWLALCKDAEQYNLGRIQLLPEPAGKVRPVALVDYWTQRVMHPVHKWMMAVLSCLPADATYNQDGAVKDFAAQQGNDPVWSIDLKSATDLIPLALYESVFKAVWGEETTTLWLALLSDRAFARPKELVTEDVPEYVYYNRGQPMGTLSSWASMALVHHAIALYAAYKAEKDMPFTRYRVLGDDIVIGDQSVAEQYLSACSSLRIPTSKPKTVVGRTFIFASQVYVNGVNVSPMSLREELGIQSPSQRIEMALRAVSRGWLTDKSSVSRFLRLLISPHNYRRAVKSWKQGKLGNVAQAALGSAFAIGRQVLDRLGFQESKFMPFLLCLQGKVQALVGSQNDPSLKESSHAGDIKLSLAVAMCQRAHRLCRERLYMLQQAEIRWMDWISNMNGTGFRPTGLYPTGLRPTYPKEARTASWKADHTNTLWEYPTATDLKLAYCASLWPAIRDSYEIYFGVASLHSPVPDIIALEAEDEGYGEEDCGMGMSFTEDPLSEMSTPGGRSIAVPKLRKAVGGILLFIHETLETLVKGPEALGTKDPLELVDAVFKAIAKMPRIPTFENLESLRPSRKPQDVDAARTWVRQMKDINMVLDYIPMTEMPTVGGKPTLSLHEEAILASLPSWGQDKNKVFT